MISDIYSISIKFLEGGVMFIHFYTEEHWANCTIVTHNQKGHIGVIFNPGVKDKEYVEYIEMSPEFDSNDYKILFNQNRDKIELVCIPKIRITDAVSFKLKKQAIEEMAMT